MEVPRCRAGRADGRAGRDVAYDGVAPRRTSGNAFVVYEISRHVFPTAPSPTITHLTFCIIDMAPEPEPAKADQKGREQSPAQAAHGE